MRAYNVDEIDTKTLWESQETSKTSTEIAIHHLTNVNGSWNFFNEEHYLSF